MASIDEVLKTLSEEARDLCYGDRVAELEVSGGAGIDAFDFHRRFVANNRPVLIKGAVRHWPAFNKWQSQQYFSDKLGCASVTVAATPHGYADALHETSDGSVVFAMPCRERWTFHDFLHRLSNPRDGEVLYVQEQNSNLTTKFAALLEDVEELPWAREAFGGADPDAVNFWMGDGRAVTSTHKDPYENVYCVVRGFKDVTLFAPTDLPWMYYAEYPPAEFERDDAGSLIVHAIPDADPVPWISVDPLRPDLQKHPDFARARPLTVRVSAGDALYLPALWFHHLQQSHGCVAVNFWYDMQFDAKFAYLNAISQLDKMRKGKNL